MEGARGGSSGVGVLLVVALVIVGIVVSIPALSNINTSTVTAIASTNMAESGESGVAVWTQIEIPYVGPVEIGEHAVQRHGDMASQARKWIKSHAGPGNRWDCPDGRIRVICPVIGCEWAIMVIEKATEITAFITSSQDYVKGIEDPCRQWMRFAHP